MEVVFVLLEFVAGVVVVGVVGVELEVGALVVVFAVAFAGVLTVTSGVIFESCEAGK